MYETYDAKTGELVRKDLDETQRGLESGELVSEHPAIEPEPEPEQEDSQEAEPELKPTAKKATKDENKG